MSNFVARRTKSKHFTIIVCALVLVFTSTTGSAAAVSTTALENLAGVHSVQTAGEELVLRNQPSHSLVLCVAPDAGDWIIATDCVLEQNEIAPRNIIVQNNATLTIVQGVSLNIDFANHHLSVANGSRVLIQNGGRIYSFPLGHLLINQTDGQVGYYLKRVNGPVLEAYRENTPFYPASTIKVLQHLHAMRAVEARTVDLTTTTVTVCAVSANCSDNPNDASNCGGGTVINTLQQSLSNMMWNSSNFDTNALQELFGAGTPSVGRAAMNQTGYTILGMSTATALQHKMACGNVANNPFNTATLADLGLLYEQVATNSNVLQATTRTTFYQLMRNETNDFFVDAVITQEANALGVSATDRASFRNQVRMAHKQGNIGDGYQSIAGWIQLPINGGTNTREFVYGWYVHGAGTNTLPGIRPIAAELLRDVIHAALETW